MKNVVNSKISDEQNVELHKMAAQAGMSISGFIRHTLDMESRVDPLVREFIALYAKELKISGGQVIESFLMQAAAHLIGAEHLFGKEIAPELLLPFMVDGKGKCAKGPELFDALVMRFIGSLAPDKESAKKAKDAFKTDRDEGHAEALGRAVSDKYLN